MANNWARIWAKCTESENLQAAFDECPGAEALYWRALTGCDSFGRLPGHVVILSRKLFPLSQKSTRFFQQAVACLEKHKLWHRYQVDGKQYLEIAHYFDYQPPNWQKMPAGEYPPPLDWQPPHDLLDFLLESGSSRTTPPKRYGVTWNQVDSWAHEHGQPEPERTRANQSEPEETTEDHSEPPSPSPSPGSIEPGVTREATAHTGGAAGEERHGTAQPLIPNMKSIEDARWDFLVADPLTDFHVRRLFGELFGPDWLRRAVPAWQDEFLSDLRDDPDLDREAIVRWLQDPETKPKQREWPRAWLERCEEHDRDKFDPANLTGLDAVYHDPLVYADWCRTTLGMDGEWLRSWEDYKSDMLGQPPAPDNFCAAIRFWLDHRGLPVSELPQPPTVEAKS